MSYVINVPARYLADKGLSILMACKVMREPCGYFLIWYHGETSRAFTAKFPRVAKENLEDLTPHLPTTPTPTPQTTHTTWLIVLGCPDGCALPSLPPLKILLQISSLRQKEEPTSKNETSAVTQMTARRTRPTTMRRTKLLRVTRQETTRIPLAMATPHSDARTR